MTYRRYNTYLSSRVPTLPTYSTLVAANKSLAALLGVSLGFLRARSEGWSVSGKCRIGSPLLSRTLCRGNPMLIMYFITHMNKFRFFQVLIEISPWRFCCQGKKGWETLLTGYLLPCTYKPYSLLVSYLLLRLCRPCTYGYHVHHGTPESRCTIHSSYLDHKFSSRGPGGREGGCGRVSKRLDMWIFTWTTGALEKPPHPCRSSQLFRRVTRSR